MEILLRSEFLNLLKESNKGLSIVDFYAEWCVPCMRFLPIFKRFEIIYDSLIRFYSVDITNFPQIREDYKISGLPSFFIIKDGKIIKKTTGDFSDVQFADVLSQMLQLE